MIFLERVYQDLGYAARGLARNPGFAVTALVTLALGVGASVAMFSVVNAVMLRGFAFPNADRLMNVRFIDPTSASVFGVNGRVHPMDFEEFRHGQRSFERLAAYLNGSTVNMTIDGTPRRYTGAYVTEDFLRILGVAPALGKPPTARIDLPGPDTTWQVGDSIFFTGRGMDTEEGQLPASALRWDIILHHCETGGGCHEHTIQTVTGQSSGSPPGGRTGPRGASG